MLANDIAKVLTRRDLCPVLIHANQKRLFEGTYLGAQKTALGLYGSIFADALRMRDSNVLLVSAPPLLLSSDAELLASEADITLLIVQAGQTTRKDLERAGRLLERLRVAGVGVIMTGVKVQRAGRLVRKDFRDYMTAVKMGTLPPVEAETT